MKTTNFITSTFIIAAPNGLHASNAVDTLIRKRLDSTHKNSVPPPPIKKDDDFLESFFGRLIQEEVTYSFSFSFPHEVTSPPGSPSVIAPTASPTTMGTLAKPSLLGTPIPTRFDDSSNDATLGPSTSLTSSPSYEDSSSHPSIFTGPPLTLNSGVPSIAPTSNVTSAPLLPQDNESSSAETVDEFISNGMGISSAYIIPAVGVVTGMLIFGIAMKAIDRRNGLQYRNLDGDSLSSFSLEA